MSTCVVAEDLYLCATMYGLTCFSDNRIVSIGMGRQSNSPTDEWVGLIDLPIIAPEIGIS